MRFTLLCLWLLILPSVSWPARVKQGPLGSPSDTPLPTPIDHPFRGTIQLAVDADDTDHGIFRVTESIPVQPPGDTVLLYPEWETTSHSATASAVELAGLHIAAQGPDLAWSRDPFNIHAFHVAVPPGVHTLQLHFEYLPRTGGEIRPEMIDVQWQRMLLYPAGWYARNIPVAASLHLAKSMHTFTALNLSSTDKSNGGSGVLLTFAPETLDRLIDAPVYAGLYVNQVNLSLTSKTPVHLDVLSDVEQDLSFDPKVLTQLRALVVQTEKIFGAPPFSHYEAILSLSDELSPGGGLEHLEEGENNMPAHFLADYAHQLSNRDRIAHEYVHAWNGRYRQPLGLWSPAFNQPTDPSTLWVYEGQTEFWGRVLAARSGMRSYQETLDRLAVDAALVANRPGREWKNLADSTLDAVYMPGHSPVWRDFQRREDYYPEGVILWLDVDARLRELSGGKVGLDQFAKRFFAVHNHPATTSTYTYEDVCATLNSLAASDWKSFLQHHLLTHDTVDVMAGLARSGWKLTYASTPTESFRQEEEEVGVTNLDTSIGLQVRQNGVI